MSAGSVYRREGKEKKKKDIYFRTAAQENHLTQHLHKVQQVPLLEEFHKGKHVRYSDEGSEEERLSGYTWELMAKCKMQPQFSVTFASQGAGAALNSWKSSEWADFTD